MGDDRCSMMDGRWWMIDGWWLWPIQQSDLKNDTREDFPFDP